MSSASHPGEPRSPPPRPEASGATAASARSEEHFQLVLAAANLGDWSWDAASDVVTMSVRAAEIFGIPAGPLMTWTQMRALLHPDDRERARLAVEQAFQTHSDYDIEYRVRRPGTDEAVWVAAKGRGRYSPEGAVLGMIGVVQEITARKRDEEKLQAQERELTLIGSNAPAILSHWDRDHRLIFASHAFAERWGKRPEELVGKTIAEVLGREAFAALRPYVDRVLAGEPVAFEMEVPYEEIGPRYVQASYAPEFGEDGRVRGYLAAVVDMTDRRRTEIALFESEERLRLATRTGKVGLWDWDVSANRVTWTESLYEIHGVRPAAFPGTVEGFAALVHPDDRAPVQRAIKSALEHDLRVELEFRAVRPNGQVVWLFANATVVRDAGRPIRMVGATLDITARKTAEQALRDSESRFRALASHAPVGIFLTNPAGDTVFVNEAWSAMVGMDADQARGRNWADAVHPDDRARVTTQWEEAVRAHAPVTAEYRFCRPDGTVTWVQGQAVPLRDARGQRAGYIGTLADVTQRRAAEEQLQRHAAELEQKVEERTASLRNAITQMEEFSYSVSHDLRAPLRAMDAYARTLIEDYGERLDDTALTYLERICRNSRRMDSLTHDVLAFSRVARTEMPLAPVDLERVVRDVISQYVELQPPAAEVEIVTPLHRVLGHELALGQGIANLLTNAAKFVAPGVQPRIRVRSEAKGARVRVWTEDNGIGIAPNYHDRLFRLFERIPTAHPYEGTGIGLAILRKSIEKMGGTCGVESDGHGGSRFWFELAEAPA